MKENCTFLHILKYVSNDLDYMTIYKNLYDDSRQAVPLTSSKVWLNQRRTESKAPLTQPRTYFMLIVEYVCTYLSTKWKMLEMLNMGTNVEYVPSGNVEYVPSGNVEYGYSVEMLNMYQVEMLIMYWWKC